MEKEKEIEQASFVGREKDIEKEKEKERERRRKRKGKIKQSEKERWIEKEGEKGMISVGGGR